MKNKLEELIDIREAAKLLNVSPATLRRWDRDGKLKSIRLTPLSRRKYVRDDLVKFMNGGTK